MVATVVRREQFLAGLDKAVWEKAVIHEEYNMLQQKVAEAVLTFTLVDAT